MARLILCHICKTQLKKLPPYSELVAKTCKDHGDFFVYRERGKPTVIIFRPFEVIPKPAPIPVKKMVAPKTKKPRKKKVSTRPPRNRHLVRCNETGAIFESQVQAAAAFGFHQGDLSKHLQGIRVRVNGYTFTRLVDDGTGALVEVPKPVVVKGESTTPRLIRCDQTGQVFRSIRQASETLHVDRKNISAYLNNRLTKVKGHPRKSVSGYTFSAADS